MLQLLEMLQICWVTASDCVCFFPSANAS